MKKRIYSGKKYLQKNSFRSNKEEVWQYSYKYEGQKSFWARTEVSPEEYEKNLLENEIKLQSSQLTISFKKEKYNLISLRKLYDKLCEEENLNNEVEKEDEILKIKANSWKSRQRSLRRKGKLDESKISQLNSHGMTWNPLEDEWEKNFMIFRKHGLNTDNEDWVIEQRKLFENGNLSNENFQRLENTNFPFKKKKDEIFKITKKTTWKLIEKLEKKQKAFINRNNKKTN